eukprot:4032863-Pyramimonas_sp.AAC.2
MHRDGQVVAARLEGRLDSCRHARRHTRSHGLHGLLRHLHCPGWQGRPRAIAPHLLAHGGRTGCRTERSRRRARFPGGCAPHRGAQLTSNMNLSWLESLRLPLTA